MNISICTLFEGDYHHGVATLSNSLYKEGYRGIIYVGYRGALPKWASAGIIESVGTWKIATKLQIYPDFTLYFLPLETTYSLTNYKPDFILELWDDIAKNADAILYFDPDIVVTQLFNKSLFDIREWVKCGVAVCEDVNSPVSRFHPMRVGWREYYDNYNINLAFKSSLYANGGFIGIHRNDIEFLLLWQKLQVVMEEYIGSLSHSLFSKIENQKINGYNIFTRTDQDALNATIEAYDGIVSIMGKEVMGFSDGYVIMPHALGSPKPWDTKLLLRSLNGYPPRMVDKVYWENTKGPIVSQSKIKIRFKNLAMKIGLLLGRFYKV
jgi:hypothetical protein